jgi:hypothetical protein
MEEKNKCTHATWVMSMKKNFKKYGWIPDISISGGSLMKIFSHLVLTVSIRTVAVIRKVTKWIAGATARPVQSVSGPDAL